MAQVGQKPLIFHGAADRAFGYETGLHIASDHPEIDAAMTFNDLVALGMLAGLSQAGVAVGKDFHLVGFDDIEESSQSYPRLSSVRCDVNTFGLQTARLLLDWLENDLRPKNLKRFPVELVVRASS